MEVALCLGAAAVAGMGIVVRDIVLRQMLATISGCMLLVALILILALPA